MIFGSFAKKDRRRPGSAAWIVEICEFEPALHIGAWLTSPLPATVSGSGLFKSS